MKTLIVYAHPQTKGHCHKVLEEVEKYHREHKLNYELIDLYKINYDPVLKEEEHYTAGNRKINKQNKTFQKKIDKTEKLIFIYPVWWYSMPAMLKGFLDRVFTSRWAFVYNKHGIPRGLLKGKRAVSIFTSGSPKIASVHPGMLAARRLLKETLAFCGIKTKIYQIGFCRKLTDKKSKQISKTVKNALDTFYL